MLHETTDEDRRRFLRKAGAVAALPIAGIVGMRAARAAKLDPSSPQAQSLSYVHDASKAGSARTEGAICGNCMHWSGGDSQWGGCNVFPQSEVNRDGWCTAWTEG